MDKRNKEEWKPKIAELIFAMFIAIVPWSVPTMSTELRCALWAAAWLMFLHLLFSLVPWWWLVCVCQDYGGNGRYCCL